MNPSVYFPLTLRNNDLFSARHTFSCGQCFRWTEQSDGSWSGIVRGIPARVHTDNGLLYLQTQEGTQDMWYDYFDLQTDYTAICAAFPDDPFVREAVQFGSGLRILRQEPWEALCVFLLSQCNNIPRIRAITERLCTQFGNPISWDQDTYYTFPTPERIAALHPDELEPLRAGYRAPYIHHAALAICSGQIKLEQLYEMDTDTARQTIMQLRGVGRKVADCFLLFGLHKLDAFPVDTWIKKIAAVHPVAFDRWLACTDGGILQQYLFYYARETGLNGGV